MTVIDPLQQLVEMFLRLQFAEAARRRLQLVKECMLEVFEHQVEPPLATEHLDHIDQVIVTQFL